MSLIDDFKARFKEFDTAVVDEYMPILEPLYPCYFGGSYTECNKEKILNLLAHLLVMETTTSQSAIKDVVSQSVGEISVSYAQLKANELTSFFNTTKYGQRYLLLGSTRIGAFFV